MTAAAQHSHNQWLATHTNNSTDRVAYWIGVLEHEASKWELTELDSLALKAILQRMTDALNVEHFRALQGRYF
jgi:hypothetical protein